MRIPRQAVLTALFEQSLLGVGVRSLRDYSVCYLEDLPRPPDCVGRDSRRAHGRCLVQAQLGWNAKQAFMHDLLVSMDEHAYLLFLDTDTAVLRPLKILVEHARAASADLVFAKASPASTNLFVSRRTWRTLHFFDVWRRLMASDEQFSMRRRARTHTLMQSAIYSHS